MKIWENITITDIVEIIMDIIIIMDIAILGIHVDQIHVDQIHVNQIHVEVQRMYTDHHECTKALILMIKSKIA